MSGASGHPMGWCLCRAKKWLPRQGQGQGRIRPIAVTAGCKVRSFIAPLAAVGRVLVAGGSLQKLSGGVGPGNCAFSGAGMEDPSSQGEEDKAQQKEASRVP